jgi:hypothetical protein
MPRKSSVADVEKEPVVVEIELEFDEEACRQRAYEISQSEHAGTPDENWLRAEQELRGESDAGGE